MALLYKMFVYNIWYLICLLHALYTISKLIELEVDMSMNLGFRYSLIQ
jgi:hypothetical protein